MGEHEGKITYEMGFRKGLRCGLEGSIPKTDYEARLKSDMVAMLTELQLEIEEMSGLVTEIHGEEWNEINVIHSQDVLSFIQEKIDKLRGE